MWYAEKYTAKRFLICLFCERNLLFPVSRSGNRRQKHRQAAGRKRRFSVKTKRHQFTNVFKQEGRYMSRKGENIYRRKDGRWEARYIKGRTSRGNIRYGYCYGKTYSEARDKLWKEKTDFLNHRPAADKVKKQRFAVYCEEWLRIKKIRLKRRHM